MNVNTDKFIEWYLAYSKLGLAQPEAHFDPAQCIIVTRLIVGDYYAQRAISLYDIDAAADAGWLRWLAKDVAIKNYTLVLEEYQSTVDKNTSEITPLEGGLL
jgi:hypothetical protein